MSPLIFIQSKLLFQVEKILKDKIFVCVFEINQPRFQFPLFEI